MPRGSQGNSHKVKFDAIRSALFYSAAHSIVGAHRLVSFSVSFHLLLKLFKLLGRENFLHLRLFGFVQFHVFDPFLFRLHGRVIVERLALLLHFFHGGLHLGFLVAA